MVSLQLIKSLFHLAIFLCKSFVFTGQFTSLYETFIFLALEQVDSFLELEVRIALLLILDLEDSLRSSATRPIL